MRNLFHFFLPVWFLFKLENEYVILSFGIIYLWFFHLALKLGECNFEESFMMDVEKLFYIILSHKHIHTPHYAISHSSSESGLLSEREKQTTKTISQFSKGKTKYICNHLPLSICFSCL